MYVNNGSNSEIMRVNVKKSQYLTIFEYSRSTLPILLENKTSSQGLQTSAARYGSSSGAIPIAIRINPDRNSDHPQNLMDCSLVRDTPLVKVLCKSVHCFVSTPDGKQTNTTKNITSVGTGKYRNINISQNNAGNNIIWLHKLGNIQRLYSRYDIHVS